MVTCERGHVVGEVLRDVALGDLTWGTAVGRWRIERPPAIGDAETVQCPCGARFWYGFPGRFHIEGRGWVPPLEG